MNIEEARYIIDKLNNFTPDCNQDCHNCEFGVMQSYGDNDICPIDIVVNLLYTKHFQEKEWKRIRG